jgi:hypothetical protein
MSKYINVNPGTYKVRGRERPGQDVPTELEKQKLAKQKEKKGKAGPRKKR